MALEKFKYDEYKLDFEKDTRLTVRDHPAEYMQYCQLMLSNNLIDVNIELENKITILAEQLDANTAELRINNQG